MNKNGFTLIELLLVLGIISIMLLLVPSIRGFNLEDIQQDQFISVFKSDILYTQNLATTTENYVRILISSDNYRLVNGSKVVFRRYYPKGIKIDTRQNPVITFRSTGHIENRKSMRITTNNAVYEVVFPLGKGRMYFEKL